MRQSLLRILGLVAALAMMGMLFQLAGCRDEDEQKQAEIETETPEDQRLAGRTVAVLVADKFEDSELTEPADALENAGATVLFIGATEGEEYTGKHDTGVVADLAAEDAKTADFDGLVIPGGSAPKTIRQNPAMVDFARRMVQEGKVVAAICHGPQVLITAGVLSGRKATCYEGVSDELKQAGADYRDQPVVVDGNIITSRHPGDLRQFNEAIIEALSRR